MTWQLQVRRAHKETNKETSPRHERARRRAQPRRRTQYKEHVRPADSAAAPLCGRGGVAVEDEG
jgi:hypothetical protein